MLDLIVYCVARLLEISVKQEVTIVRCGMTFRTPYLQKYTVP